MRFKFVGKPFYTAVLFTLVFVLSSCSLNKKVSDSALESNSPKVLLVLAHPDDETMLGGTLLELKRLNVPVYAVYLTSGEGGKQQQLNKEGYWKAKKIKSSKLKLIREQELEGTALNYGFQKHFLFHQKDKPIRDQNGLPIRDGHIFLNKDIWNIKSVKRRLLSIIESKKPSYIITMSLDKHNHAHHKASRLITQQLNLTKRFKFIKGVYAFSETGWVKEDQQDESKQTKILFDRSQLYPNHTKSYAELTAEVSRGHYSQNSGHREVMSHKEELYLIEGELESFYGIFCQKNNCDDFVKFIKK